MTNITLKEIQEICRKQNPACDGCPISTLDYNNDPLPICYLHLKNAKHYDINYLEQRIKEWREKNEQSND